MNLGTIAADLFNFGYQSFNLFNVSFGDVSINGWYLLLGGAIVMLVFDFLGRVFQ